MSDTPPAARSRRRRHGTSWASVNTFGGLRSRLVQLAVLPCGAVLLVVALLEYLLRVAGPSWGTGWLVWVGGAVCAAVLVGAWRLSSATADAVHRLRSAGVESVRQQWAAEVQNLERRQAAERLVMSEWIARLRSVMADSLKEVQTALEQLHRGEQPQVSKLPPVVPVSHPLAVLERDLREFVYGVQTALADSTARQERAAVLSIARRILSLINNALLGFDALEREMEDPEILGPLWRLDHVVTRLRRLAESLTMAGGAPPRRASKATLLSDVIIHAVSEVEQYDRITVVSTVDGMVEGRIAPGLAHLLAELLDNAATFSAPQTKVVVRVEEAASGVVIQVDDRGKLMPHETLAKLNELLSQPSRHRAGDFLRDGRIGMWVVAEYARLFHLDVRLQENVYGSNQALIGVPAGLFSTTPQRTSFVPAHVPGRGAPAADARAGGRGASAAPPVLDVPRSPAPSTGEMSAPGRGTAPLPSRRATGGPHPAQGQAVSRTPAEPACGGSSALPQRDLSRSYLAPGLQDQNGGYTPPSAPPSAALMSRVAAGRRRAEQDSPPDSSAFPRTTDHPLPLEAPRGDHGPE